MASHLAWVQSTSSGPCEGGQMTHIPRLNLMGAEVALTVVKTAPAFAHPTHTSTSGRRHAIRIHPGRRTVAEHLE